MDNASINKVSLLSLGVDTFMSNRVLLVDDNRDLIDCLAFLMEDTGIQVSKAYDLLEAKFALQQDAFDLIFLDIRLPDGNGLSLYYDIKLRQPAVKIVPMTGFRLEQILNDVNGKPLTLVNRVLDNAAAAQLMDKLVAWDTVLFTDFRVHRWLTDSYAYNKRIAFLNEFAVPSGEIFADAEIIAISLETTLMDLFAMVTYLRQHHVQLPLLLFLDKPDVVQANCVVQREYTGCVFKPFDPQQFLDDVDAMLMRERQSFDASKRMSL